MPLDPNDIYHNGYYYSRNGGGGPVSSIVDPVTGGIKSLDANGQPVIDLSTGFNGDGAEFCNWVDNGTLSLTSANGGGEAAAIETIDGIRALKCTFSSGTFIANFELTTAIPVCKLRTLQIPLRFSSNVGFVDGSNPVQVWMYDNTLAKQWRIQTQLSTLRSGKWTTVSAKGGAATEGWTFAGGPTSTTDLDNETIKRIRIVCAVPAGASGVNVWVGPLKINARKKGCVSIVMDGEYDSQSKYVLPMLNGYGLRSSLALVFGNIGTGGKMTLSQLSAAYDVGHEMIHHTYDQSKTGGYAVSGQWADQAAIQADIAAGQAYLTTQGWTRGIGYAVHGYSYPYDYTVAQARQDLVTAAYAASGIKAVRKSVHVYNRLQTLNGSIDPYLIQGGCQVASTDTSTTLNAHIDKAEANGEWLIITIHESVLDSATPAGLQVKNGDLDTSLAYLASRARLGGLSVLPFGEACRQYGITT